MIETTQTPTPADRAAAMEWAMTEWAAESSRNMAAAYLEVCAEVDALKQDADVLADALDGMSNDANLALPQVWHDYMKKRNTNA